MQTSDRDDDRRALRALLARLEVYEAPRAFFSDPDPQVGDFDDDAWEEYCLRHGLEDFDDRDLVANWIDDLRKGDCGEYGDHGRPQRPTKAPPRSRPKVREMIRRAERGEELFHPCDAPMDGPDIAAVPLFARGNHKLIGWAFQRQRGRKRAA